MVKLGGRVLEDPDPLLLSALRELWQKGKRFILVHGGGREVSRYLEKLGIPTRFHQGFRVTDEAALEVVEMVLSGRANRRLTRRLIREGLPAVGLSGSDGILYARRKERELGLVGEVVRVEGRLLQLLLEGGFLPVVSTLALGKEEELLNVNADLAAAALAAALAARLAIFLTDVPGFLRRPPHEDTLVPRLTAGEIEELLSRGEVEGGMIPKLLAARRAVQGGVGKALLLDGRTGEALAAFVREGREVGTVVVP